MKFILSFLITGAILSASPSYKLSLGHAALNSSTLCDPSKVGPSASIKYDAPKFDFPTTHTIKCDLPTLPKCEPVEVAKCTPAPVICSKPTTPVIDCPKVPGCPKPPVIPCSPSSAPEPASYALIGVGLATAGVARKFRAKK
jgi:hypothetical protein